MNRLAVLLLWICAAPVVACDGLAVEQGWIRLPPPGMTMTAGYAKLANRSKKTLTIDRVSGEAFGEVELHQTRIENGVARMRSGLPLRLAPGAVQALEPGGYHLMLFEPARAFETGETTAIRFHCGESSIQAPLPVRTDAP